MGRNRTGAASGLVRESPLSRFTQDHRSMVGETLPASPARRPAGASRRNPGALRLSPRSESCSWPGPVPERHFAPARIRIQTDHFGSKRALGRSHGSAQEELAGHEPAITRPRQWEQHCRWLQGAVR